MSTGDAFAFEFEYHLVRRADRAKVPEVRAAYVDADAFSHFFVVKGC